MDYPDHIIFEPLDDGVHYQVTDTDKNRYFCGELNETLDFYNAWSIGKEPFDDVDYYIDWESIEFESDMD